MPGILSKERTVAPPGYNRWLVPPAALAIHLCIGQAYAFSVFNLPLGRVLGVTAPAPGDWKLTTIGWAFTIPIAVLGLSAAFGGRWLERAGPRKSGVLAAFLWGSGFLVSALAVRLHVVALLYLGYGVLGGSGLGLGYITPVSTLIRWFPDRRGMATGMAIMGFGGGAMIAAPLEAALMRSFASPTSTGVAETFAVLGAVYFAVMLGGAFLFRVPGPSAAAPVAEVPAPGPAKRAGLISAAHVSAAQAIKTPQFYLLWAVLFLNVTAGIGILGQASAMIQEVFKGTVTPAEAAGFVGLLSLFNMGGRFLWASLSDRIGRRPTYAIFLSLGPLLYAAVPFAGRLGSVRLFVGCVAAIMTMYGGGFATIPAYLADMFGTANVGAIHGRLLTAWSAAGVAGPVLVNYIRQYQLDHGAEPRGAYDVTLYVMAALLVVGFFCNAAVRPVDARHHMSESELGDETDAPRKRAA